MDYQVGASMAAHDTSPVGVGVQGRVLRLTANGRGVEQHLRRRKRRANHASIFDCCSAGYCRGPFRLSFDLCTDILQAACTRPANDV